MIRFSLRPIKDASPEIRRQKEGLIKEIMSAHTPSEANFLLDHLGAMCIKDGDWRAMSKIAEIHPNQAVRKMAVKIIASSP